MAQYDANVLQEYADLLYRKADWIVIKFGAGGAVVGSILGLGLEDLSPLRTLSGASLGGATMAICAIVGALIGVAVGRKRSLEYRLLAQTSLCQMRIEYNTRRSDE